MGLREINSKLNDFFVKEKFDDTIMGENLYLVIILTKKYIEICENLCEKRAPIINENAMPKFTALETIEIVKGFYRELQIPFDIEKHIANGRIGFESTSSFSDGRQTSNPCNMIDILQQGRITDAFVFTHEISHYRDQPERATYTREFLTESLATADELIFARYLENHGYKEESVSYQKYRYFRFYKMCKWIYHVFKAIYLYQKLGSISKENYQLLYHTLDEYEEMIEEFSITGALIDIHLYGEYVFAVYLGTYLCQTYEERKDYHFLEELHQMVKDPEITILNCLQFIGLDDFNPHVLIEYVEKAKDRLMQDKTSSKYFK